MDNALFMLLKVFLSTFNICLFIRFALSLFSLYAVFASLVLRLFMLYSDSGCMKCVKERLCYMKAMLTANAVGKIALFGGISEFGIVLVNKLYSNDMKCGMATFILTKSRSHFTNNILCVRYCCSITKYNTQFNFPFTTLFPSSSILYFAT